jgi:hypothetical protein
MAFVLEGAEKDVEEGFGRVVSVATKDNLCKWMVKQSRGKHPAAGCSRAKGGKIKITGKL